MWVESGIVRELKCENHFSYLLNDPADFLPTEYKVLQSQENVGFLKCMKMLCNGKIQLYYFTGDSQPLPVLLDSLNSETFAAFAGSLIGTVAEVKTNGFLSCQNIDLTPEHIYVEPATLKVSLAYLPIHKKVFEEISAFENELRTYLVKLAQNHEWISGAKTEQLVKLLSDGTVSLDGILGSLRGNPVHGVPEEKPPAVSLKIVAMAAPVPVEFDVGRERFVLGKSDAADGVISFDKTISREHCRVDWQKGGYTVTDLQSKNGTCLNGARLISGRPYPVRNGDILRMSKLDFQLVLISGGE